MESGTWELLSYVVTVVGLPAAIAIFVYEQRQERLNEEDTVFESLSDNYQEFLRVVLENPDLRLFSTPRSADLTPEQQERMTVVFCMLISLFERAYILLYEPRLRGARKRRWQSWEDSMREWCQREDFRDRLPALLVGEDPDFCEHIGQIARRCAGEPGAA